MKGHIIRSSLVAALLLAAAAPCFATPSTTYWTVATSDIQPFGVFHITVDNYFTLFKDSGEGGGDFPTDVGLTAGILPFEKIQMEVGVDIFEPSDDPLFFNAKIGIPEGALMEALPAINFGIYNVGTESGVTDQNILTFIVGKSLGRLGRVHAGYYNGNEDVLVNGAGEPEDDGFLIGYDKGFLPVKDGGSEYNRIIFAADYASGDNAVGGGGIGIYYFFAPNISLLTGPVWFNDEAVNGEWKWTIQLDINF